MANKIFENSRYAGLVQTLENNGRTIFVPRRRPLERRDFQDNIIHTVMDSDRVDSISSLYYGTPIFAWIISDFNDLLFPDVDLKELDTIILPSLITLQTRILPNL